MIPYTKNWKQLWEMYKVSIAYELTADETNQNKMHSLKCQNKTLSWSPIITRPTFYIWKLIEVFLLPIVKTQIALTCL